MSNYDDYYYSRRKDDTVAMAGKIILAIIMIVCLILDAVYLVILFGGKKIFFDTNIVDQVTLKDGVQEPTIEVNYFQNKDGDGLELFEIKFTSLLGENRENTFSQGIQFVGKTESDKLSWEYVVDKNRRVEHFFNGGWWIFDQNEQIVTWGFQRPTENTLSYQYQSIDNFKSPILATNEIGADSVFKTTLGEEIYAMQFKWDSIDARVGGAKKEIDSSNKFVINPATLYGQGEMRDYGHFGRIWNYWLSYADLNFFSLKVYDAIQSVVPGTDSGIVFKFADLFNFYKCTDEKNGKYEEQATEGDLFNRQVENYFNIKIQVHANGAKRASDSMFNAIKGDAGFNLTGNYEGGTGDYFYGKNVLDVDIYDFEYVFLENTTYNLKLKEDFVTSYLPFVNQISLRIILDLDELEKNNIVFGGFTENSGLNEFTILECKTRKTIEGHIQENDVDINARTSGGGV